MSYASVFANGPCTVAVFLQDGESPEWEGSLALSGSHTFDDPDNEGETYTIAVSAAGRVTLTSSATIGGEAYEWKVNVTPVAFVDDVAVSGFATHDDEHTYDITMRADGVDGDDLTVEDGHYVPDPYVYGDTPSTSLGVRVVWGGT